MCEWMKAAWRVTVWAGALALGAASLDASPRITEFMAANDTVLADEDGDFTDWIEVFNPDRTAVDLGGWHLTDTTNDLERWTFPSLTLAPGRFLVVFASNKNRRSAGQPLHTNFKLDAGGEYLALVAPDGATVVSAFAPTYPPQLEDVGYGSVFASTVLVASTGTVAYTIPTAAQATAAWTAPAYNDAAWSRGAQGLGFSTGSGLFDVRLVRSTLSPGNVAAALNILTNASIQTRTDTEQVATINYLGTGADGMYSNGRTFPGMTIGTDLNNFVVEVKAFIYLPTAGDWTFGVDSDDGFRLSITNVVTPFVMQYNGVRGPGTTLGVFTAPAAGVYALSLVYFEQAGGAEVECFAAPGRRTAFDAAVFRLVGDTANGGIAHAGLGADVRTNIRGAMQGVNASVWLRAACNIPDPAAFQTLVLRLWCEDGAAIWLNGAPQASLLAPATPAWNAAATASRSNDLARTPLTWVLDTADLRGGANMLAVQGLNDAAADPDFLLATELTGATVGSTDGYFATPTPGAPNPAVGKLGYAAAVVFSVPHGLTNAPFALRLACETPGASIYYTTNGALPSPATGTAYSGSLTVSRTTVLRARAFRAGYEPSPVVTQSYLFPADIVRQSPAGAAPGPGWPGAAVNGQVLDYGMDPTVVDAPAYAAALQPALRALPSISLVTDLPNLFNASTGIYVNASGDGPEWERAASIELIEPSGTAGFSVNGGLRIRGGFSRSTDNPKHGFRLLFRDSYGVGKLNYPLFGAEGAEAFDALDLRADQNYSWSFLADDRDTKVREVWNRDLQRDMAQPYTRSRYYHLYLDGHYWGIYQSQERAEAGFCATYLGGAEEEYDVVKVDATGGYEIYATDGTLDAWRTLWQMATNGFGTDAAYCRAQGLNADRTPNPAYPKLLDIDNLIDLMIGVYYSGDLDSPISNFLGNARPNNMFAAYNRVTPDGFKFFRHDGEHTLLNVNENRTGPFTGGSEFRYFNPQWLHQQLTAHPDYRMRFADRVQRHFFNGGTLTAAAAQARFSARMREVAPAMVAESARWGDAKREPAYTLATWSNACNWVLNGFMAGRNAVVLQQFQTQGWLPTLAAPTLNAYGGTVASGFAVTAAAATGAVYFATGGADPRQAGGALAPSAVLYALRVTTNDLVAAGSVWAYLDTGADAGTAWRAAAYDDAAWARGPAQFGYGEGDEVTTNASGLAGSKYVTTYYRRRFAVTAPGEIQTLTLQLLRDDGAVAYLNGQEILRSNMPSGTIGYMSLASTSASGTGETTFFPFTVPPSLLVAGENVLAVEVHQNSRTSSDLSFDLRLTAVRKALPDGLRLAHSDTLKFRTLANGSWSPLTEAFFAVGSAPDNLRVTEIMYHPLPPPNTSSWGADDFEFIEVQNTGTAPLDLLRVHWTAGLQGALTNCLLQAGERAVLVANLTAFGERYDTNGIHIAGVYAGRLANEGEALALADPFGAAVQSFAFDDKWSPLTDGDGYALVCTDPRAPPASWGTSNIWQCGSVLHGTPGRPEPSAGPGQVVINELLAHTDASSDWVELYNPGGAALDLSGWLLSDDRTQLAKFVIPVGTVLDAGGYVVFTAADHFDNPSHPGARTPFALSELGESIHLAAASAEVPTGFLLSLDFGATAREVTLGRHRRSSGEVEVVPLAAATPGAVNAGPRVGPLIINELMYHPATNGSAFIELFNRTEAPLDLFLPAIPTQTWRFAEGIGFAFPPGVTLPAHGYALVVAQSPDEFRTRYGVPAAVPVFGPYTGALANDGERLLLVSPTDPEPDGFVPYVEEERLDYRDDAPWPEGADGTGLSLQRLRPTAPGNDPANWTLSRILDGSPGEADARAPRRWLMTLGYTDAFDLAETGDVDRDGACEWEEYIAGTQATNGLSALRLTLERNGAGSGFDLIWQAVSGRQYRVLETTLLPHLSLPGEALTAQSNGSVRVPVTPSGAAGFYRVSVKGP